MKNIKCLVTCALLIASINICGVTAYAEPTQPTQSSFSDLAKEIQIIDNQVETSMHKIDDLKTGIEETTKNISEKESEVKELEEKIDTQKDIVNKRAVGLYKEGFSDRYYSYLSILLNGKDLGDIIDRYENLKIIMDSDSKIINEFKDNQTELSDTIDKLNESKEQQEKDKKNLEEEVKKLEDKKKDCQKMVDSLKASNGYKLDSLTAEELNNFVYSSDTSEQAKKVIDEAKKYLGIPYVWGGTTPSGFDCSGLMQYVFEHSVGIHLPRVSQQQQFFGQNIPLTSLKPGDMIFFGYPAYHVGLYIGNGLYIQAPETGDVVKISKLRIGSVSSATRVLQ